MAAVWKTISKSTSTTPQIPPPNPRISSNLWKPLLISKSATNPHNNGCTSNSNNNPNGSNNNGAPNPPHQKLKKCTSLRVATSFTRVCLCAPISSYTEIFRADLPPRRSYSYPRSRPITSAGQERALLFPSGRMNGSSGSANPEGVGRVSVEGGRRVFFRGKSLTDDVLMRRFVEEEEAAMMQVRIRRNQMDLIKKRSALRRNKLGPSPLSKMVMAE